MTRDLSEPIAVLEQASPEEMPVHREPQLKRQSRSQVFTKFHNVKSRINWTAERREQLQATWERGDKASTMAAVLGCNVSAITVARAPGLKAAPDRVWSSQARAGSASSSVTANGAEAAVNVVCTRETSMIDDGAPYPVELLRDRHGVYGISVSELFDFELTAARAGVELEPYTFERPPGDLILRPDWFFDTKPRGTVHRAVLQKIVGGFRRGPFKCSHEERLRQFIHHEALNRSGLPWPPRQQNDLQWWSEDKKQQAHNRGVYHGLRQLSLHVINHLIGRARRKGCAPFYLRAPRAHLPRRRAQSSCPSIDRDVSGPGARYLLGLAGP